MGGNAASKLSSSTTTLVVVILHQPKRADHYQETDAAISNWKAAAGAPVEAPLAVPARLATAVLNGNLRQIYVYIGS